MTVMNVVHMRVCKSGQEAEYIRLHKDLDVSSWQGGRNFWLVKTGERSFIVVGEWADMDAMVAARPRSPASTSSARSSKTSAAGAA